MWDGCLEEGMLFVDQGASAVAPGAEWTDTEDIHRRGMWRQM